MNKLLTLHNVKKITSIFAILFVVILYTIIKAPYFDQNFTGEHPMKYSAYVEPAIYMVENNDFSWNQRTYYADPIENPKSIYETLPQFPKIEWSIATMMKVFPNFSIETNTRLVMHLTGIMILVFSFLSVKELTNKKIAFFFSLLLATNPIFGLATFVTVYDSVILAILFASLYFLALFLKNRKPLYLLAIAGALLGFGLAAKVTLLIWAVPIVLILIFSKSPNFFTKLFDTTTYFIFMAIPYLATKLAIPTIGTQTLQNSMILLVSIIVSIALVNILQSKKEKMLFYLESLHKKKFLIPILILAIVPITLVGIQLVLTPSIREEFIADTKLLFSLDMYIYMTRQFVRHIGIPLAILGIAGIVSLFFIKEKSIKVLNIAFLTAGAIFLLSSSKSIFFHDYYTIFLMAVILLSSATAIYFITEKINHMAINTLILILIFFLILIPRIASTQERFEAQQEDFDKALEYFIENTDEHDFYIDEVQATYFSLYSGRSRVGDLSMFDNEIFKEDVKELGFKQAMDKYNIKYLITFNEEPDYEKYANIFSQEELQRPSYRRSDLILSIVNPEKYEYFEDIEKRERIVEEENLKEKFVFEKQIGNFKFFTFVD